MAQIDWKEIKMVVFDVDGTLYDQEGLRKQMMKKLLAHYAVRPWKIKDLAVLMSFRKQREAHAGASGVGIDRAQYAWAAKETKHSEDEVERIVTHWMLEVPLPLLVRYRFDGLLEFLSALQEFGVLRTIYSDYPYERKLSAMQLSFDGGVDSTDARVDAFKPDPKGLKHLLDLHDINPEFCVFIGDRDERDGECARLARVHSLIVDTKDPSYFKRLTKEFRGSRA